MKIKIIGIFISVFLILSFAAKVSGQDESLPFTELYRIGIHNIAGGNISVSKNAGRSWENAGKVVYPTQKTNENGYTASKWAKTGDVAASAINAIHIKTDNNPENGKGVIFSLVPAEMKNPPEYYNSFLSPDSSIYTDIPAGNSIFGGGYSPFVGNPVEYICGTDEARRIEEGYVPQIGDIIIIKVLRPFFFPNSIVFENKSGGEITVNYEGGESIVIGEVLKAVQGVGRFTGTLYANVGRIRANHTGVIDISTSRIGKIGGFQIIPFDHSNSPEMGNAWSLTQWMVVGQTDGVSMEGQAPLFSYYLQPKYAPMDLDSEDWLNDLLGRFIVDVKTSGSDKWDPMPMYWLDSDLKKKLPDWAGMALKDITHIRILFPVEGNYR